jgi:hypothetical protein
MKNKKYTRKKKYRRTKKIEKNIVKQDVWGKRIFIPLQAKRAIESIDRLSLASDLKKRDPRRKWYEKEYRRRMMVELKKSRKSRKLYAKKAKISNKYKTIKRSVGRIPIKKLENIYYDILFKQ